ncbi:MAG TPA: hypothetical protein VKR24_00720 [Candidatus Limnocylindrales bacterium]|nr:hypothetical protein [Candidatus Limnocylindrales bacterium]
MTIAGDWDLAARQLVELQTEATGELLQQAVDRAFNGDIGRLARFVAALAAALPPGTRVYLRGSAVAGASYRSHEPFDARGPGSSDLDIVVCGPEAMALFSDDGFYIPGINSRPLCDTERDVAPRLDAARSAAQAMAGRPVSIQAMDEAFLNIRSAAQETPFIPLAVVSG